MRSILLSLLMLNCVGFSTPILADTSETEIKSMLDFVAEEWSEGDLDSIRGNIHRDFVLLTADGVRNRDQRVSELEIIMAPGQDHGELSYSDIEVKRISKDKLLVYGKSSLKFEDGTEMNSVFSSIYVNTPFGWKSIFRHE